LLARNCDFIGDEIVKPGANARDGIVEVVHHPKSETDGQEQAWRSYRSGRDSCRSLRQGAGFTPNQAMENGGEAPEQVSGPTASNEAKILA